MQALEADEDLDLVQRTLAGELDAFEPLVRHHRDVVFRVAARIVGRDDAEDVTQDAFLRAFHKLSSFHGDSPFRAWLLRIAHNTALNALARSRYTHRGASEDSDDAVEDRSEEPTPEERLELEERHERLVQKLSLLRPAHRSVLVLRDLEGMTYEEIADVTDSPLGSVKGRIHRARGELIDLLRRNTYDWELPDD